MPIRISILCFQWALFPIVEIYRDRCDFERNTPRLLVKKVHVRLMLNFNYSSIIQQQNNEEFDEF